jgi:putative glutamine amidotransferase
LGKKPLIGITPGFMKDKNKLYIPKGYMDGVISAGGLAMLLPLSREDGILEEAMDRCDGFLLSGGADIDAKYFGEVNFRYNGEISPFRDYLEIFLAKRAVEQGKAVLGICRGVQVLNVALGGTLYQDIYSQIKDRELLKHSQDAPDWYPIHDIHVEKGSKVWKWFEKESIGVNSFHHQAVKEPGKGLKITAWSEDGIVEAVEHEGSTFAVGVQWHPELMYQENAEFLKIFEALVKAAYM